MARIVSLLSRRSRASSDFSALAQGASIEVTPRTAERVADFRAILPGATRIYVAHIDGAPLDAQRDCVARLAAEGFAVMPHIPARSFESVVQLDRQLAAYSKAGATEALVLAGGRDTPAGPLSSSMDALETGAFEQNGFTRLHVAGHPEGNPDIQGSAQALTDALLWKQEHLARSGVDGAIVTQFLFEAEPALDWARAIRAAGVTLPVHLGVAGPAKLQTLVKYAALCGVGASMRVLTRRAADLTRLALPFTPDAMLGVLSDALAQEPSPLISGLHVFPLGGIGQSAEWLRASRGGAASETTAVAQLGA